MEVSMRLLACAVAGLVVLGTAAASAQPGWGPDGGRWVRERGPVFEGERAFPGPMRPRRIARIVRSLGLDPVGPPDRHGALVVQPAADDDGRAVRVSIDVHTGEVVSVMPVRAPGLARAEPYGPGRFPAPGPYARVMPDDEDIDFAPPGPMRPRADLPPAPYPPGPGAMPQGPHGALPPQAGVSPYPPPVIEAPKHHKTKSATATPAKPPLPRKRPEGKETARKAEPGSVAPLPPASPPAPPAQGAAPAPSETMPPVAPLE
jgi:hypothetical protein